MTSKEAISVLKSKFEDLLEGEYMWLWNKREHDLDLTPAEDGKAIDLAIKALEREEVCKNTEKCEKVRDIQFGCSACECYVWYVLENGEFNYCPNCGRKVEK